MKKELEGKINRLRVFRAVKAHMEEVGECPTAAHVARELGLDPAGVVRHMNALHGASGLPLPIKKGAERRTDQRARDGHDWSTHVTAGRRRDRGSNAAWAPVPVDLLMTGGGFGRGGDE